MRWVLVLLLAGCASLPAYYKPGASSGDMQADIIDCGAQGKRATLDVEVPCMKRKGWEYR